MSLIREPYVNIDLTVQYRDLDIEPLPNTPIVGGVVRSNYYADYYYNLSEKDRIRERKAIEIKTKRQFFEKITMNNPVKPEDHLSLKNAYYLSGSVHAFFAPEIPNVKHSTSAFLTNNINIRDRVSLTHFFAYRIDNNNILNTTFMSAIWDNETDFATFYTIPIIRYINLPDIQVNNQVIQSVSGNAPIYYLNINGNSEKILFAYECDIEDPLLHFTSLNTSRPIYIIITKNYLLYIRKDTSTTTTGFLFKKMANFDAQSMIDLHNELISSTLALCTDDMTGNFHNFSPRPIHSPVGATISNSTAYGDLISFLSGLTDDKLFYLNNYILALITSLPNQLPYVPYNTSQYGINVRIGSNNHNIVFYNFYFIRSCTNAGCNNSFLTAAYESNSQTPINNQPPSLITSGYFQKNLTVTNTPTSFSAFVNNYNDSFEIYGSSVILKITNKIIYRIDYHYDEITFTEAIQLLDMVDLLVDNGYCTTKRQFNTYSGIIASHAINMDGEKLPALAVINTPIAISPGDVTISSISPTEYVNTFLCANYFKYEGLGYPTLLPASSLYAVKVVSMFTTLTGYNPIYNKPIIPISPIDKVYSETERQILLNKAINSLKPYEGSWVFNNNVTLAAIQNNIFKEENIRRLANKIARELKLLLKTFIGRKNTKTTRASVVNTVKRMYAVHIEPHEYKPDEIQIICDDTNNRDYDRYLYVTILVKMPLSIKYIELVTVAMDLEQS